MIASIFLKGFFGGLSNYSAYATVFKHSKAYLHTCSKSNSAYSPYNCAESQRLENYTKATSKSLRILSVEF